MPLTEISFVYVLLPCFLKLCICLFLLELNWTKVIVRLESCNLLWIYFLAARQDFAKLNTNKIFWTQIIRSKKLILYRPYLRYPAKELQSKIINYRCSCRKILIFDRNQFSFYNRIEIRKFEPLWTFFMSVL